MVPKPPTDFGAITAPAPKADGAPNVAAPGPLVVPNPTGGPKPGLAPNETGTVERAEGDPKTGFVPPLPKTVEPTTGAATNTDGAPKVGLLLLPDALPKENPEAGAEAEEDAEAEAEAEKGDELNPNPKPFPNPGLELDCEPEERPKVMDGKLFAGFAVVYKGNVSLYFFSSWEIISVSLPAYF